MSTPRARRQLVRGAAAAVTCILWALGLSATETDGLRRLPPVDTHERVALRSSPHREFDPFEPANISVVLNAPERTSSYPHSPALASANPLTDQQASPELVPPSPSSEQDGTLMPPGFEPWWQPQIVSPLPLNTADRVQPLDVNRLALDALVFSEHIRALRQQPAIVELGILEAQAEFDPAAFMESKFVRTSEPVGDQLTTGGPPRFRESDWTYVAGIRRRDIRGGQLEASQRIGYLDSNSTFLTPTQQGNARLTVSFEQPLLRGGGKLYNTSLVLLAEIDTRVAHSQTTRDTQSYLLDVHRSYWELYLQRAVLLQMRRSLERALVIQNRLRERQDFDSTPGQVVIAEAAVESRRSKLVRAAAAVQNAQARIGALVNSPMFVEQHRLEILPAVLPRTDYLSVSLEDALVTALHHRPEVNELVGQLDATRVRLEVARNELLPALSVVLEAYVSGLQGNSAVGDALRNQFRVGEPGYSAGLLFEVPLFNRAANARHERRQREMSQLTHRFNAFMANLKAEVEIAVREVSTTFGEVQSKYKSMVAAAREVDSTTQRFELLPGEDRAASLLLQDLLLAQERLSAEEFAFVEAQIAYAVAQVELKRATGVLLEYDLQADQF